MDGTPIFNLVETTLPGCTITGFRGILNTTTNFVLAAMERGEALADAVAQAQRAGFAEADPSLDMDGWDAAAKVAALMNVLMDADTTPSAIRREGISEATAARARAAKSAGRSLKVVCEASAETRTGSVSLQELELSDPLAHVSGTSSALAIYTDLMGQITIVEHDPAVQQTAYALVTDLIRLHREAKL